MATDLEAINQYDSLKQVLVEQDPRPSPGPSLYSLDDDQSYWLRATFPVFWRLLQKCNYPESGFLHHIGFYILHILPALGPAISPDPSAPIWPSFMTDDYVPIELSWSWTSGSPDPVTRFAIEPVPRSPDASRLVAWERALDVFADLTTYSKRVKGPGGEPRLVLEDHLFQQLARALILKASPEYPEEATSALSSDFDLRTENSRTKTTVFYGFDLGPEHIRTKAYFILPHSFTDISEEMRVMEEISLIFPSQGWASLHNYLSKVKAASPDVVHFFMIAIDCTEPAQSRLKLYVRYVVEDLEQLRTHLSLGGAVPLSKQFSRAVENAWNLSFPEPDGSLRQNGKLPPVLVYYDLFHSSATPGVKVYFPMRYIGSNDFQVAILIQKWFLSEPGFHEAGRNFVAEAQEICHTRPLSSGIGMFSYFGIAAHGEDRIKAYIYINPQIRKYPIPSLPEFDHRKLEKQQD